MVNDMYNSISNTRFITTLQPLSYEYIQHLYSMYAARVTSISYTLQCYQMLTTLTVLSLHHLSSTQPMQTIMTLWT